jgi:SnoaL-like domain
MAKLHIPEDCGNSPKSLFLRDFTIAFVENKTDVIFDAFADDVIWTMLGEKTIHGKQEAKESLKDMLDDFIAELTITNIITHGDTGAVNGTMLFKDGKTFGYCDVYTFTSHARDAKIKTLTSYIIELPKA